MDLLLANLPLLLPLPILLIASGFFSGSETALFGLTQSEQLTLRRRGGMAARAALRLRARPRMLLISVLLGNMVVNVLYFVLSAVLIMQLGKEHIHPLFLVALPPVQLVAIILLGEVLPKLVANHDRGRWITFTAVPLHAMHRVIGPVRIAANSLVIEPLVRLTAPSVRARSLDAAELGDLLRLSAKQGVIDDQEERLLGEVVRMSARKVRDVMVPRTEIEALPNTATHEDVVSLVERTRFTKIPIYDQTIDHVLGILRIKEYLACDDAAALAVGDSIEPILFVPEVATIESLIDHLRKSGASIAIAVDEFGLIAGLVAGLPRLGLLSNRSAMPLGACRGACAFVIGSTCSAETLHRPASQQSAG